MTPAAHQILRAIAIALGARIVGFGLAGFAYY